MHACCDSLIVHSHSLNPVHHTNRSCLEEIVACLGEKSCNSRMVPFVQECNAYRCNQSQCREALRQFYLALPLSVAEKLVFCDCDREDQECQQMKASLHSGSCASDQSQTPWTCLEALDSCSEDTLCRLVLNIKGKALTKWFTTGCVYRTSFLSSSYSYSLGTNYSINYDLCINKFLICLMLRQLLNLGI